MSAPAHPAPAAGTPAGTPVGPARTGRRRLHLVLVPSPGPALTEDRGAVRLLLPGSGPARPAPPPGPRPRAGTPAPSGDRDFGPTWTRRADLPDAAVAGRQVVTLALEAFAGRRPLSQLQRAVSPQLYAALSTGRRPRWCSEGTAPLAITSVRVCEPVDGVAEVTAVARRAGRVHAVAARLEGVDGRWRCTALQVG